MDDTIMADTTTSVEETDNESPLAQAKRRTAIQPVELPGFGDGKPWFAKLRRISLLAMARAGRIPNTLMSAVTELYQTGVCKSSDLSQAAEVMFAMAREALVEPTLDELINEGVTLTDEQLTAIYLYAQRGADALRPFRQKAAVSRAVQGGRTVRDATEQLAGHL